MKPEAKLSHVDPEAGIPSFYSSFSLSLPKTAAPAHRDKGTTHPPLNHAQTKHHNSQNHLPMCPPVTPTPTTSSLSMQGQG